MNTSFFAVKNTLNFLVVVLVLINIFFVCVFSLIKLVELTVTCRSSIISDIILFQSGNTKKMLLCQDLLISYSTVEETNVLYQFSQEKRVPSYVPTCVQESINPIELALERKFSVVIPQENNVPFLTTREIKNPGREIKNLGRLILRRGSIQDRSTFQRNCFPQFKSDLRKSFEDFSSFTGIEAFLNWVPAFRADISLSLLTVDAF